MLFQEGSGLRSFPLDQYHNSCHLFWVLEQLLHNSEASCRVPVEPDHMGFLTHLDQHVLLLSEEFPLFSIYMWRTGLLLTSSDRPHPNS